jgi:hypothetical protein
MVVEADDLSFRRHNSQAIDEQQFAGAFFFIYID